jgi:hypothetical protein
MRFGRWDHRAPPGDRLRDAVEEEQAHPRVVRSLRPDRDGGFLYALDRASDWYLVLAAHTAQEQVGRRLRLGRSRLRLDAAA